VNAASTTYTYPATSHRLSSLSGATTRNFSYDNAGNVAVSAGITYVYDGRGRMKQSGTTTYLVNGLGQRVKKATSVAETYFAYDEAGHLIGEYDTSGAPIQETVWLGDLPVAVVKPTSPSGFSTYFVWADQLGAPRLITDAANQARWEWPNNDPFGNNPPNDNPRGFGGFAYNLRFPGQYYDSETGNNYNYFRDYDASIGRYIQSDPIGLRGGLNTFAYVSGKPLNSTDEKGLAAAAAAAALAPGLGLGSAGAALGTLGVLGAAGAVGVALGTGFNMGFEWAFGISPGSALYDAFGKSCFVETCKLAWIWEHPNGGATCVYNCPGNGGARVVRSKTPGCAPTIGPKEGNPYP
jgi:RHS repeat-associated protein